MGRHAGWLAAAAGLAGKGPVFAGTLLLIAIYLFHEARTVPIDDPAAEQVGRDREREGGLAGARRRDREEVARLPRGVAVHRRLLSGAH